MSRFHEYCRVLGVAPHASEEEVKSAFRAKIKLHHPDKATHPSQAEEARRLIEAYHAVLAGEGREEEVVEAPEQRRPEPPPSGWVHQEGREAARRMFERVFRDKFAQVFGFRPDMGFDFDAHFGADPREQFRRARPSASRPAGANSGARPSPRPEQHRRPEQQQQKQEPRTPPRPEPASPNVSPGLRRAEDALGNVVDRFQNRGARSKREWCRDYLANLAQVQILFRDLATREPRSETAARLRLGQIKELMSVIRTMAS